MSYTKRFLSQGRLLITSTTKNWSEEDRARADDSEKRLILADFNTSDEGRGRIYIAEAQNPENARRLVACWNACQGITTEAIEAGFIEHCTNLTLSIGEIHSGNILAAPKEKLSYGGFRILEATDGE